MWSGAKSQVGWGVGATPPEKFWEIKWYLVHSKQYWGCCEENKETEKCQIYWLRCTFTAFPKLQNSEITQIVKLSIIIYAVSLFFRHVLLFIMHFFKWPALRACKPGKSKVHIFKLILHLTRLARIYFYCGMRIGYQFWRVYSNLYVCFRGQLINKI